MPNWYSIGREIELRSAGRKLFSAGGHRLAVFFVDGKWVAIDNHCPHKGGPIAAGELNGRCLVCPWHGLQFDVETGHSVLGDAGKLTQLTVRVDDRYVQVDLDSIPGAIANSDQDGIKRYLVRYGAVGDVGLFGTVHRMELARGVKVVVATARGIEMGELLRIELPAETVKRPSGELLREASAADHAAAAAAMEAARSVLPEFESSVKAAGIKVQIADIERLMDGQSTILYYLGEDQAELGPLAVRLSEQSGHSVRFQKLRLG